MNDDEDVGGIRRLHRFDGPPPGFAMRGWDEMNEDEDVGRFGRWSNNHSPGNFRI
jgi:hypothetical protein